MSGEIQVNETPTYGTIVTDLGVRAVFDATTLGEKVNITTLAAGDGGGEFYTPTPDMTGLKNEVWRGAIGSYEVSEVSKNMITVRGMIPSEVGGFTVRELALFTEDGTMIAIANTPDTEKVAMVNGVISTLEVVLNLVMTNSATLTFTVDASTIVASAEDLKNHNLSETSHPALVSKIATLPQLFTGETLPEGVTGPYIWYQPFTGFPSLEGDGDEVPDIEENIPEEDDTGGKEEDAYDLVELTLTTEECDVNVEIDGTLYGVENATYEEGDPATVTFEN